MRRSVALAAALLMLTSCSSQTDSSDDAAKDIIPASSAAETTKITQSTAPESSLRETVSVPEESSRAEEYPSEIELTINEPEAPQITAVNMTVETPNGKSELENAYGRDFLASGTVGLVGCPVKVTLCGSAGVLTFRIDKDALGSIPFENLAVLKTGDSFDEVDHTSGEDTVTCLIKESGTYLLVDSYQWDSAWGGDTAGKEHETEFTVGDFGFRVTFPKGVAPNSVSDYWHAEPAEGSHIIMKQDLMLQNGQNEARIRAELYASRFPNEDDSVDDPLPFKSFDDRIDELSLIAGDHPEIEATEVWDVDDGRRGFIAVFHFPENKKDGIREQTNINAYYEYTEDTYITLNLSFFGYDSETVDECFKSAKSFTYYKH